MTDSPLPSQLPTLVRTVPNGSATIEVWFEHEPDCQAVMVDVEAWAQELHIPVDVAVQVAHAILDAHRLRSVRRLAA